MEQLAKSFRRRSRLIIGIAAVILILVIATFITSLVTVTRKHGDHMCCDVFNDGRGHAMNAATSMALAMSQLLSNPASSKTAFTSYFTAQGVFSTIMGNTIGVTNIDTLLQGYINAPGETNVSISIKNMYWDYKESTLTVEETWTARTTGTKQLWDGSFAIITYPSNTTYTTDDVIIITFDCNGKIVRYRQISSTIQRVSTYSSNYPDSCSPCESPKEDHHQPHHHHTHAPQQPMTVDNKNNAEK